MEVKEIKSKIIKKNAGKDQFQSEDERRQKQ